MEPERKKEFDQYVCLSVSTVFVPVNVQNN